MSGRIKALLCCMILTILLVEGFIFYKVLYIPYSVIQSFSTLSGEINDTLHNDLKNTSLNYLKDLFTEIDTNGIKIDLASTIKKGKLNGKEISSDHYNIQVMNKKSSREAKVYIRKKGMQSTESKIKLYLQKHNIYLLEPLVLENILLIDADRSEKIQSLLDTSINLKDIMIKMCDILEMNIESNSDKYFIDVKEFLKNYRNDFISFINSVDMVRNEKSNIKQIKKVYRGNAYAKAFAYEYCLEFPAESINKIMTDYYACVEIKGKYFVGDKVLVYIDYNKSNKIMAIHIIGNILNTASGEKKDIVLEIQMDYLGNKGIKQIACAMDIKDKKRTQDITFSYLAKDRTIHLKRKASDGNKFTLAGKINNLSVIKEVDHSLLKLGIHQLKLNYSDKFILYGDFETSISRNMKNVLTMDVSSALDVMNLLTDKVMNLLQAIGKDTLMNLIKDYTNTGKDNKTNRKNNAGNSISPSNAEGQNQGISDLIGICLKPEFWESLLGGDNMEEDYYPY